MSELVSVIIPVYNVETYLRDCLVTVLNQTYRNLEILCVNDGSLDSSRRILSEFAKTDPRIQIFDKPNGGLSDARNYALDRAQGKYIACIDSDDMIRKDMIELLVKRCEETGSDIAVCDMQYFYDDGRPAGDSDGGQFDVTSVKETPSLIAVNNSACNKLIRKELFDGIRFPVGKYYEDLAVIPILMYKADRVCKVNEPLYFYRQRSGSIAHTANQKIFHIYDALDAVSDYVKQNGNEADVLKELHRLYLVHGLDITTLRIREFDDRSIRKEYLAENMKRLRESCPDYQEDPFYKNADWKKKLVYWLLGKGYYNLVLKLYDR